MRVKSYLCSDATERIFVHGGERLRAATGEKIDARRRRDAPPYLCVCVLYVCNRYVCMYACARRPRRWHILGSLIFAYSFLFSRRIIIPNKADVYRLDWYYAERQPRRLFCLTNYSPQ